MIVKRLIELLNQIEDKELPLYVDFLDVSCDYDSTVVAVDLFPTYAELKIENI